MPLTVCARLLNSFDPPRVATRRERLPLEMADAVRLISLTSLSKRAMTEPTDEPSEQQHGDDRAGDSIPEALDKGFEPDVFPPE